MLLMNCSSKDTNSYIYIQKVQTYQLTEKIH